MKKYEQLALDIEELVAANAVAGRSRAFGSDRLHFISWRDIVAP
jgi:hypothetical protein